MNNLMWKVLPSRAADRPDGRNIVLFNEQGLIDIRTDLEFFGGMMGKQFAICMQENGDWLHDAAWVQQFRAALEGVHGHNLSTQERKAWERIDPEDVEVMLFVTEARHMLAWSSAAASLPHDTDEQNITDIIKFNEFVKFVPGGAETARDVYQSYIYGNTERQGHSVYSKGARKKAAQRARRSC